MKNSKTVVTVKVCNRCPENGEQPVANFRTHKSGYSLNQCKVCERAASKARRKKVVKVETLPSTLSTPNGRTFEVSATPVAGSRKVSHEGTTKVIYVIGASRDEVRSIFAKYAGVTRNRVKSSLVA